KSEVLRITEFKRAKSLKPTLEQLEENKARVMRKLIHHLDMINTRFGIEFVGLARFVRSDQKECNFKLLVGGK
ncbi:hypothetical protein HPULCUR_007370, partial [Helicostylum pulchrum]